jgi:hypothetical protein
MKTLINRRELFAAIGIGTLVGCRRSERPQPEPPQGRDSTVTLTVDGMI